VKDWKEYKLGDAPLQIIDGDRGKNYPSRNELCEDGYCLFLSTKNVRSDGFDFNSRQYISKEKDKLLRQGRLEKFDLVLTTRGTVGNLGYFNNSVKYNPIRLNSGMVIIRPNPKYLNSDFNFYIFRNLQTDFQYYISGSAQPQLPIRDLSEIPILLPPLAEQKAIAAVLSSLDDKIDLLHRQNKTLEAMAETLFRQWFVEPCKDGLPDGWEEGKLGDVVELHYGKGLKTEERTGFGYPVVGSSGIVGYHAEYIVEGPIIVIGRKGTLGKVIYLWENCYPIDTTYYIKSKIESSKLLYEYFLLKSINFEDMNTDSAVPGLNRDIALSTEINLVPQNILHNFSHLTIPFIDKLKENNNQIRILEKLRDTLLPKLMSGEVRVAV